MIEADAAFSSDGHTLYKFNPLRTGLRSRSGPISGKMAYRTTSCITGVSVSVANPAPVRYCPTSMSAPAAGGGKRQPRRNAACTQVISATADNAVCHFLKETHCRQRAAVRRLRIYSKNGQCQPLEQLIQLSLVIRLRRLLYHVPRQVGANSSMKSYM